MSGQLLEANRLSVNIIGLCGDASISTSYIRTPKCDSWINLPPQQSALRARATTQL